MARCVPLFLLLAFSALAQEFPNADLLRQPPRVAAAVTCPKVEDWSTPSEKSCYRTTPRYDETIAYISRIAKAASRQVRTESFGRTGQGRELLAVIVSKDGVFDPVAIHKANRPVIYIQNSIHAGEMDGKDASLALLRDMLISKSQAALLDRAVLVVVPIYNADGHEYFGKYNRINQNGPEEIGWRANATDRNLNRDYMKAEAPETRAFLKYWNHWLPDFFVDNHVTDGADYQYDVTYLMDTDPSTYAPLAKWANEDFSPEFERRVNAAAGHLAAPYIDFVDQTPNTGIAKYQSTPRFSTAYVNLQNRPGLLIEMHMLKDYGTRVTGNYEALRAIIATVNRDADKLVRMNREADEATIAAARSQKSELPIRMEATSETLPFEFKGYKWTITRSEISGADWVSYEHDQPITITIPRRVALKTTLSVTVPAAYIVPAEWTVLIDVLTAHGLQMRKLAKPWTGEATLYRCETPEWTQQPFEGHHVASWPKPRRESVAEFVVRETGLGDNRVGCRSGVEKATFAAGSVVVPTNQRASKVAMHWLEPEAPDSAMQWGLLDAIFEQKEYGEAYVLERLARKMIADDPKLKQEFDQKLASDPQFAENRSVRLNWFYQHSPWWDSRIGLYPVARLSSMSGLALE
jgi:hypothetical protein